MKTQIKFLSAVLFCLLSATFVTSLTGITQLITFPTFLAGGILMGALNNTGVAMAGLAKEIWISRLMDNFYASNSFLNRSVDMSEWVDYNTINLAEAGVDPVVLVDNNTFPVASATRTDNPVTLSLSTYDTENVIVRNVEATEAAYAKLDSVIRGAKAALQETIEAHMVYNWAPASTTANTPVINCTGAANAAGVKTITLADIAEMQRRFDMLKAPVNGRVLVLHPNHRAELLKQDIALFKQFANLKSGEIFSLYGFDIYSSVQTATYNKTTLVKKAFGAAAAGTDTCSSLFYQEGEVMKADGDVKMFSMIDSPTERGTLVGFQKRAIALPIRNKLQGSIVSGS